MKRIISFSPHKTALTIAIVFAVISLIFVIPMFIGFSFIPAGVDANGNPMNSGPPLGFMLGMPFMYFIMSYIFTVIGCWFYNRIAKYTGGIEVEFADENNS